MFDSLKVHDNINGLTIGMNTDSNYVFKEAKGNVNYTTPQTILATPAMKSADTTGVNPSFSEFYNQIGQGTLVKNASQLAPLDSYTTKGSYADSQIKLYGQEITITVLVLLTVILSIFLIIKSVIKQLAKPAQTENHQQAQVSNGKLFFIATGISFASVVLLTMYTFGTIFLANYISSLGYYQFTNFLMIFVFLISALVYLFFLFTPAIFLGLQKGIRWGIVTFGITICWTIIALFLALGIVFFFSTTNNSPIYPPIYPMRTSPVMMKSDAGTGQAMPPQ